MYDTRFGTDWDALAVSEVIERAFALGVADACGAGDDAEFDRLRAALDAYDRDLVEFVFRQGRSEARELRSTADSPGAVWTALIEDRDVGIGLEGEKEKGKERTTSTTAGGPPGALRRVQTLERGRNPALPGFLRRD